MTRAETLASNPAPLLSGPSPAAEATAATQPAPTILAAKGTAVIIEIDDRLNSSTAKIGDTFRLHLAEPLIVDGKVVAAAGATGGGEVINASRANIGGRPGELTLMARYLEIDGQRVKIGHLRYGQTGRNNDTAAFVAGVAVGLPGYLITGGNVDVPAGTRAGAKLTEPLLAPTTMSTPPPAPAPAPTTQTSIN
jgi:hypothetical protein